MITGALARPAVWRTGPPLPGVPGEPQLTRRGVVLLAVVAAWTAVPSTVASPKLTWLVTLGLLALVANALWWHQLHLQWTARVGLVAVLLVCGTLSMLHFGTLAELATATAAGLLLLGCALLAATAGADDVRFLARGLMALALVELVAATASALLGVPAPWGYLGEAGSTFEVNPLVPELSGRATGTMAHPIPFGTVMALSVLLALSPVLRWPTSLRLLAAAGGTFGVALSGSRSAALSLLVTVLVATLLPGALRLHPVARTVVLLGSVAAFLSVQVGSLAVVTSLQGTGSLTHRLGALDAAERLADRPLAQTLLGSGTGSLHDLFTAGLLQLDGFFAVDNQFVATFATAGLLGVLALAALVVAGLVGGHRATRPAALLMVSMFLSFDVLEWNATAVLTVVLLVLRPERGAQDDPPAPSPAGAAPSTTADAR